MPDSPGQVPVPLKREREQTVQRLIDHYAADNLTVEEFESRLDSAYTATSRASLDALLAGLPVLASDGEVTAVAHPPIATAPAEQVRNFNVQIAIMSGSERKGAWVPPRKLYTLALMGGAGLDFREARMPPGETEVNVLAMMGGVEIIVPPGLAVETHGFGLMGGFEALDQAGDSHEPNAPRLVIRGMAVMGGVDVTVRLPGETAKEARQRRKLERKERRQLKRGSGK
jgi:hypothetical protein